MCAKCRQKFEQNITNESSTCKLLEEVINKLNDIQKEFRMQKNIIEEQGAIIEKQGKMIENLSDAINIKNNEITHGISKVIKTQEDIVETYSEKVKKKEG